MSQRRRRPQDHKHKAVKAAAGGPFTFTHNGNSHTLPPASEYATGVSGGAFMDMILDGDEMSATRLAVTLLRAAKDDIDPRAYEALRSKPMTEFGQIVGDWMQASGVEVGESERSST